MERVLRFADGEDAAKLAQHFLLGFPIDHLRVLLESSDPGVVECGAFIASELGARFRPLMDTLPTLLLSPTPSTRSAAIDCVAACASEHDGKLVASALSLLRDEQWSVRFVAMRLVQALEDATVLAALHFIDDVDLRDNLRWMVEAAPGELREGLGSSNLLRRRLAVAHQAGEADLRATETPDSEEALAFMRVASTNADFDTAEFGAGVLRIFAEVEEARRQRSGQ